MRRSWLLTSFLALAGLALWVACAEAPPPEPEPEAKADAPTALTKIADGVWFREGERDQGHCNNVIIELEDGLFVVDANFPSGAQLVMEDVKTVSDKPVKWVFDTHHHGDHAYGNPLWTKAGATTLAYVGVAEEIKRYEPAGWLGAAQARPDVAALNLPTLEPPQQTFTETPHVVEDGKRRIELHHFGWAHTRGDGFVYLPNEKILATGDAATNGPYNFTGHGNTGAGPMCWPERSSWTSTRFCLGTVRQEAAKLSKVRRRSWSFSTAPWMRLSRRARSSKTSLRSKRAGE
ncbi:MAG: MBL fold metallo-hydrolase [Bryobacterales bacterium]